MNAVKLFKPINRLRPSSINLNFRALYSAEAVEKRLKNREMFRSTGQNNANLTFLGGVDQGLFPSLIINSEGHSYLFNCGEGFQRFCFANKVKIVNLEHVFVTSHQWNHMNGVIGLSITLQNLGIPSFCLHSPGEAKYIFDTIRLFVSPNENTSQYSVDSSLAEYHDSSIKIKPIALAGVSSASCPGKRPKLQTNLIAYACELPEVPGPLDPIKCKELGVPVGKHLSRLKSGEDVILPGGKLIKSSDVCGPVKPGANLIIIECPSESHIETVITNPTLKQLKGARDSKGEKQIDFVVHYTPPSITEEHRYREWMDGFSDKCKHLFVLHDQKRRLNNIHIRRYQYMLNKLDAKIFPQIYLPDHLASPGEAQLDELLKHRTSSKLGYASDNKTIDFFMVRSDFPDDRFINVNSMDKLVLRPKKSFDFITGSYTIDMTYREAEEKPDFDRELTKLRSLQANIPAPREYEPEVVFLGTGSSIPSKYRNTSCILLNFHHTKASVILDCGEDSYGQMYRFYGPDRLKEILKQLKMIYVSHHHLDHHIGLIEILRNRKELTNEPLQIVLPSGLEILFDYYNSSFNDLQSSYELHITKTSNITFKFQQAKLIEALGGLLKSIDIVGVEHCRNSCAVIMHFNIGHSEMETFSVAYSGDTLPSGEFASKGKGCDLLIHEATIEDSEERDALIKKHCTAAQAIEVAKAMRAKFTILTHFTQRLPKIPYFTELFDDTIGFAFDNMSLRCPTDFARLPILKPCLKLAFDKEVLACELRKLKKDTKRQRDLFSFDGA